MKVVVCPGVHERALTEAFLAAMDDRLAAAVLYPADRLPAYSPQHVLAFLRGCCPNQESMQAEALLFLGFSAGVVGAIGAARQWQRTGGRVAALIAIDGWGVPLLSDFPIHRLSHDVFTHWSSAALGAGQDSFYADPAVGHLELWRSPLTVRGWWIKPTGKRLAITAAKFLLTWLNYYENCYEEQRESSKFWG